MHNKAFVEDPKLIYKQTTTTTTTTGCPAGVTPGPTVAAGANGCTYDVTCGAQIFVGDVFETYSYNDFDVCLNQCDDAPVDCVAVDFDPAGECTLYRSAVASGPDPTQVVATQVSCPTATPS